MTHIFSIRVYYEDTDAGGIVYYANYLKFAERARTELLRTAGIESASLRKTEGILIVVRHVEADYRAPARLDDLLTVETVVKEVGNSSFSMHQRVLRDKEVLCAMTVKLVCVGLQGRPVRIPGVLKEILAPYMVGAEKG